MMNPLSTISIFVVVIFIAISYNQPVTATDCGPNEIESSCALLQGCQPTCDNPNGLECFHLCSPDPCVCKEGFIRDSINNLVCIEVTQCNAFTTGSPSNCGPNEIESSCALLQSCQPSCDNPNGTECDSICSPHPCVCKEGFIRDPNNNFTCINKTKCDAPTTGNSSNCGPNEIERSCAPLQSCQPTCDNPNGTVCDPTCSPNPCVCKEGFVRDSVSNLTCIEETTCGTLTTGSPSNCGLNEIETSCAPLQGCQPTCDNPNGLGCFHICSPDPCVCKEGFLRDSINTLVCIEATQCNASTTGNSSNCGPNEIESSCALLQSCQPSCDNPNGTICDLSCSPDPCVCKEGFIRDPNNNFTCIETTQCQQNNISSECDENEVYDKCANPCQPSCDAPNRKPCPTLQCSGGCICRNDYLRATNSTASPCVKCND